MLCIIAGHFGIVSAERFVFTFHVPLFFLLSGYFLSTKVSFLPFMKQKARQLLVPYYVTGVVLLIVATIVNHFVWPEIDALNNAIRQSTSVGMRACSSSRRGRVVQSRCQT